MDGELAVSVPLNEFMILGLSSLISGLYTAQTGIGMYSLLSLLSVSIVILGGIYSLMVSKSLKNITMSLFGIFLLGVSAFTIATTIAFYKNTRKDLQQGYTVPVYTVVIILGIIFLLGFVGIMATSFGGFLMSKDMYLIYNNIFTMLITIVIVNAGLMAGS